MMSLIRHAAGEIADDVLITRVRGGDLDAYGELFARHRDSALRLARSLVHGAEADDLVSDAFAKVLNALQSGSGPDVAFRAYLLTSVRRLHVDRIRSRSRTTPTDDIAALDEGVPFSDTAVDAFESSAAARAYGTLPERWQMVLWHLEVEGQKPADIAPLLGMSPNAVAALGYRAREGLRQAFVQMHAAETAAVATEQCRAVRDQLGAFVRDGLSRRDRAKVSEHLESCRRCTALYLELSEVNSSLAAVLGPIVLGSAAAAYLASTAGAASTGGLLTGLGLALGRARDVVVANSTTAAVTGAAVVAGSVGVGAYAATHRGGHEATATAPIVREHQHRDHPVISPPGSTDHRSRSKPIHAPRTMREVPTPGATPVPASSGPTGIPVPSAPPSIPVASQGRTAPAPVDTPGPSQAPTTTPDPPAPAEHAPAPPAISMTGPNTATGVAVLTVKGLPATATGTVTLRVPPSLAWWTTPGCQGRLRVRTCPVSANSPTVTVRFRGLVDRTFTATLTPGPGVADRTDGDDAVLVRMRGVIPIGLHTDAQHP